MSLKGGTEADLSSLSTVTATPEDELDIQYHGNSNSSNDGCDSDEEKSVLTKRTVATTIGIEDPAIAVLIEKYDINTTMQNDENNSEPKDVRTLIGELEVKIHQHNLKNSRIFFVILFAVIVVLLQAAASIGTFVLGAHFTKELTISDNGQLVSAKKTKTTHSKRLHQSTTSASSSSSSSSTSMISTKSSHNVFHVESNSDKNKVDQAFLKSIHRLDDTFTFMNTQVTCQEYHTSVSYGQVQSNYHNIMQTGDYKLSAVLTTSSSPSSSSSSSSSSSTSGMVSMTPTGIKYDSSTQTYHVHGWTEKGISQLSGMFAVCKGATKSNDKCAVCASDVSFYTNGTIAYGSQYQSKSKSTSTGTGATTSSTGTSSTSSKKSNKSISSKFGKNSYITYFTGTAKTGSTAKSGKNVTSSTTSSSTSGRKTNTNTSSSSSTTTTNNKKNISNNNKKNNRKNKTSSTSSTTTKSSNSKSVEESGLGESMEEAKSLLDGLK